MVLFLELEGVPLDIVQIKEKHYVYSLADSETAAYIES